MSTDSPREIAQGILGRPELAWHSGTEVRMARALVEIDKVLREKVTEGVGRERRLEAQSPGRFLRAVVSPVAHLTVAEQAVAAILDGTTEGQGT